MVKVYVVVGTYHPDVKAGGPAAVRVYTNKESAKKDMDFLNEWAHDVDWNMREVEVIGKEEKKQVMRQ